MESLKGKIALIIGATSDPGIGSAIARKYAEEGAKVVISGRRQDALDKLSKELNCLAVKADISNDEEITSLVNKVIENHGILDIAVNSVGIYDPVPIAEMTRDHLQLYSDLHFISPT